MTPCSAAELDQSFDTTPTNFVDWRRLHNLAETPENSANARTSNGSAIDALKADKSDTSKYGIFIDIIVQLEAELEAFEIAFEAKRAQWSYSRPRSSIPRVPLESAFFAKSLSPALKNSMLGRNSPCSSILHAEHPNDYEHLQDSKRSRFENAAATYIAPTLFAVYDQRIEKMRLAYCDALSRNRNLVNLFKESQDNYVNQAEALTKSHEAAQHSLRVNCQNICAQNTTLDATVISMHRAENVLREKIVSLTSELLSEKERARQAVLCMLNENNVLMDRLQHYVDLSGTLQQQIDVLVARTKSSELQSAKRLLSSLKIDGACVIDDNEIGECFTTNRSRLLEIRTENDNVQSVAVIPRYPRDAAASPSKSVHEDDGTVPASLNSSSSSSSRSSSPHSCSPPLSPATSDSDCQNECIKYNNLNNRSSDGDSSGEDVEIIDVSSEQERQQEVIASSVAVRESGLPGRATQSHFESVASQPSCSDKGKGTLLEALAAYCSDDNDDDEFFQVEHWVSAAGRVDNTANDLPRNICRTKELRKAEKSSIDDSNSATTTTQLQPLVAETTECAHKMPIKSGIRAPRKSVVSQFQTNAAVKFEHLSACRNIAKNGNLSSKDIDQNCTSSSDDTVDKRPKTPTSQLKLAGAFTTAIGTCARQCKTTVSGEAEATPTSTRRSARLQSKFEARTTATPTDNSRNNVVATVAAKNAKRYNVPSSSAAKSCVNNNNQGVSSRLSMVPNSSRLPTKAPPLTNGYGVSQPSTNASDRLRKSSSVNQLAGVGIFVPSKLLSKPRASLKPPTNNQNALPSRLPISVSSVNFDAENSADDKLRIIEVQKSTNTIPPPPQSFIPKPHLVGASESLLNKQKVVAGLQAAKVKDRHSQLFVPRKA